MKALFITTILLITLAAHSQNCTRPYNITSTAMIGVDSKGITTTVEMGLWGVDQPFGVMAGFMIKNNDVIYDDGRKGIVHRQAMLDLHVRATYKIGQTENYYHLATVYGTMNGDIGFSYRLYREISNILVIGVEPSASIKRGGGLSAVFTFNF